jgi:hypothetical protein
MGVGAGEGTYVRWPMSSIGKPARLPAAVNSLSRSADCKAARHFFSPTACVRAGRSPARSNQRKPFLQPASTLLITASNHALARA